VAVVNYIPFLGGYYAESLDVLKLCLESICQNSDLPFDLLVFDNASCPEVRDYLAEAHACGQIQFLVLSDKNIGKGGAWNFIFSAAPGEYLAYADNDIYFYPGWLSASLKVLETFPEVGMVTGMPLLSPKEFSTTTVAWASRHPEVYLECGHLLPWEDFWRHAGSLGNTEAKAREFYESHEAIRLTYRGQTCYVGAGHFQFLARKEVLQRALPIPSQRPMGQVRALDVAINQAGYLRLCTTQWWVRHMGNTLGRREDLEIIRDKELVASAFEADSRGRKVSGLAKRGSFLRWKPLRKLLTYLHDKTFDILYRE
jgi:glycosyltransferase involved in cell wall biosynthesis